MVWFNQYYTERMNRITYTNEIVGAHSNQINGEAGIYVDGEIIGVAQYVLYNGELTISDIFVRPEFRRRGYGSRLIKYIKQENPDYKYIPSMKTEDGAKFIHKDLSLEEGFKAKFVYENLEFERGSDPKRSLGIGKSGNPLQVISLGVEMLVHPGDDGKPDRRRKRVPIIQRVNDHVADGILKKMEKNIPDGQMPRHLSQYKFYIKPKAGETSWANIEDVAGNYIQLIRNGEIYDLTDLDPYKKVETWNEDPLHEKLDFERGINPKKTMEIGRLSELKANWDRKYPNQGVSPEDAMDQLIDQSLRDNIIWKLDSHQPEWTVMYQVNVLNYLILNGGEAPYSDIKPERGIPEQTMRRVFRALVENGTLVKGKIGRSVWYYLAKGKYAYRDSFNESLDFERGRDPKGSMDIGMKSKMIEKYLDLAEDNIASGSKWRKLIWDNFAPELIAAIPDRFKNDKGEPKTFGWGNFDMPLKKNVFTPEELGIFYNIINKYWNKVFGANESVNFERGIDPKEKMNIGMRHDAIEIITIAAEETGADFEGDQIHEILSDVVENPETQDEWAVEYYVDKAIPITDWRNLHSFSGRYVMYDGTYYLIPFINYNEL